MTVLVKDLETQEEQTLEVRDIMLGAYEGDDRTLLFLEDGSLLELQPATRYLVGTPKADEPEPPPVPEEPVERPPTPDEDRDALLVDLDYRLTLVELGISSQ